jgi:exo-beta-1,3-glucanase (GH17 family)
MSNIVTQEKDLRVYWIRNIPNKAKFWPVRTIERHQKIESQKEFAIAVKGYPFSGILFSLRAGKVNSAKEAMSSITQNKLESLLLGESHD